MVRYCVYRNCKNTEKTHKQKRWKNGKLQSSNLGIIRFFAVPKPTTEYEKCLRWLSAINRPEIKTTDVRKHHYVCANHFLGGFGPTIDNPDPLPDYKGRLQFDKTKPVVQDASLDIIRFTRIETIGNLEFENTLVQDPLDNIRLVNIETPTPDIPEDNTVIEGSDDVLWENSIPAIEDLKDIEIPITPIPATEDPRDIEPALPPIESLQHLARDFLYNQANNMETIKWNMEIKRGTTKNDNVIRSLVFKNRELMKLILKPNMTITVTVCDQEIPDNHVAFSSVHFQEPIISLCHLIDILFQLERLNCCQGIQGELFLYFKDRYLKSMYVCSLSQSLRSEKCQKLLHENRELCRNCRLSKKVLQNRKLRLKKSLMTVNATRKFTSIQFLNRQELRKKYDSLYTAYTIEKSKMKQSKEVKIKKCNRKDVIFMSREDSAYFENIIEKNAFESKTSFQKLLKEQMKLNAANKTRRHKWHPAIIKWCLSVKAKSPTMYEALRQAIALPSKRTLYSYSDDITSRSDFDQATLLKMSEKIDLDRLEEHQKHFSLILDEIQVKQDLVFRSNTGELVGATNLNTIRNKVTEIEKKIKKSTKKVNVGLATRVLQLMVKGITTNFNYAYAYFPHDKLKAEDLYSILWKAIEHLQGAGFKIISVVCDKAEINQKLIKFCTESEMNLQRDKIGYRCKNPFNNFEPLYFIFNVCHCVKTAKNDLANSGKLKKHADGIIRPIKLLKKNGRCLLWKHVIDTYKRDSSSIQRLAPKLTYAHVYPNSYSCKKVKFCVQVLSSATANAMQELVGDDATETIKFLHIFDQFFDILNVSNCSNLKRKQKPALAPFTSLDDWRFEWLIKDFLGYLDEWEEQVNRMEDDLPRSKIFLSQETLQVLRITVHSTIGLIKYTLEKGAPFVLTAKFNLDPVEQYFSRQRSSSVAEENSTVGQRSKEDQTNKIPYSKNGKCSKIIEKSSKKTAARNVEFLLH